MAEEESLQETKNESLEDPESELSERKKIENYVKQHCLQEFLDEAINKVVEDRPGNPYLHLAQFMETKTLPEIMDLKLNCCIISRGLVGVQAILTTNFSTFESSFPISNYNDSTEGDMLIDFAVIQSKTKEALRGTDPTKTEEIDDLILGVKGMSSPIAMAVSIACARAGARHSGKPLHIFLSEQIGSTCRLPVPVVSLLTRAVGGSIKVNQSITAIPTTPSFLDNAMEAMMHAVQAVHSKLDERANAEEGEAGEVVCTVYETGCPCVSNKVPLLDAIKLVKDALSDGGIEGTPKIGLDFRACDLTLKPQATEEGEIPYEDQPALQYQLNGDNDNVLTAEAIGDVIGPLWRETELISIEDPISASDTAVDQYQDKIDGIITDIKSSESGDLRYNLDQGVGGDPNCSLQVVADRPCTSVEDVELVSHPFNAIKVSLNKCGGTVTKALKLCQAVNDAKMTLIVGCLEGMPESPDAFAADLAVATGAYQFSGGGLGAVEYACKYARLLEIARDFDDIRFASKNFRNKDT